jgi:predicted RNase H-like nuclease
MPAEGERTLERGQAEPLRAALPVSGVDGCPAGWVAVTLSPAVPPPMPDAGPMPVPEAAPVPDAAPVPVPEAAAVPVPEAAPEGVTVTVAAALDDLPLSGITGIDMPLGLLAAGWRDADFLARRALGRRGATVFAIPPRPVWECESYPEANQVCRALTGKGMSIQAWGLRRKITAADEFRLGAGVAAGVRLHEVHPELSFAAMAGAPLTDSKHTPAGLVIRRELLAKAGILLPPKISGAAENDLLDAAAVAWSARRIQAGVAVVLTNPEQRTDDGAEIAVRY